MFDSEGLQGFEHDKSNLFTSTVWDRIGIWAPLVVVLAIAVLIRVLKLDVFYGRDELVIWRWSDEFFSSLWRGDLAHAVLDSDYPGITVYWLQSLYNFAKYGFLWLTSGHAPQLSTLIEVPRSLANLAERRLVMGLATSAQVWGIYALAARSFNRRVALLGAFLVAVDPFLLAESRMLRAESLAAGFMILSVLAWLVYLKENRWRYLALSGLLAGWAILTKVSSIFLVPIIGLVLLFDLILRRGSAWQARLKQNVKRGLAWSGLAVLGLWLSWPTLWVNPIPPLETVFVRGIAQASQVSTWHGDVFFAGRLIPDDPGLLFYPVAIAFRSTPLMWLGAGLLIFFLLRGFLKNEPLAQRGVIDDTPDARQPWPLVSVAVLFLYIGVTFVLLSLTLSKVDRYLLPILPALDLLTALGLVWLYDWLADKDRGSAHPAGSWKGRSERWRRIATGGVLVVCTAQLGLTLSTYPYFYSYWNPLLGGGSAAVKMLPVGSGEGLDKAIDVVNQVPDAENQTLICGASQAWCEGKFAGTTWSYGTLSSGEWMQADYVLLYIAWSQRQSYPQEVVEYLSRQPPVYQVELGGATYAWLYKVPEVHYSSGTKLEGRGTLYGYNLSATQLEAGQVLTATLYWRNEGQQPTDAFFVDVVDTAGYVWATALAQPRPGFEEANRTRQAIVESEARLALPPGMPPGHYFLKMGFVADNAPAPPGSRGTGRASGQVLVGRFELPAGGDDVLVKLPSGSFPAAGEIPIQHRLSSRAPPPGGRASWDGISTADVSLLGYAVSQTAARPGENVWLTLFWQAQQDAPRDYAVGVRLLAADGHEVTYWLGRPFYSGYPTPEWSRGQVVQDPWELTLPEDVPPGDFELEMSLYDASSSTEVARTSLGTFRVLDRQADAGLPRMQYVARRTFGDVATLLGYDLSGDVLPDGVRVRLTIHWQALRPTDQPYSVSVRLVDGNGLVMAEQESAPAAGKVSTTRWQPGEVVADLHEIEVTGKVPASGNLEVRLLDAHGNSIPMQNGSGTLVISELSQKVMWQVLPQ
jgi:4-amino-4-deoxy-L-arabinose transferase-like glycosyltransferase